MPTSSSRLHMLSSRQHMLSSRQHTLRREPRLVIGLPHLCNGGSSSHICSSHRCSNKVHSLESRPLRSLESHPLRTLSMAATEYRSQALTVSQVAMVSHSR